MKKVISVVLCVLLAVTCCACGKKSSGDLISDCYDYNIEEYITLGQYENIVVTVRNPEPTEDEIQAKIDSLVKSKITYNVSDTELLALSDIAVIDFEGSVDGEVRDNMCGSTELELGSGSFIPGFEEGLVGAKKGDVVTLNLTFPEDYHSKEMRGVESVFVVTVNSVKKAAIPELTDDFIAENTTSNTVEDYREYIRTSLKDENEQTATNNYEDSVWNSVVENATVNKYPEDIVEEYKQESIDYVDQIAQIYYGMTLEEYVEAVGYEMSEFEEIAYEQAQGMVKSEMVIYAMAKALGYSLSENEYSKKVIEYVETYGATSVEAFEETYSKKDIVTDMAYKTVIEEILKTASQKTEE